MKDNDISEFVTEIRDIELRINNLTIARRNMKQLGSLLKRHCQLKTWINEFIQEAH